MTQIFKKISIAAVALAGAIAASGASADTILVFGQTGTVSNFQATQVGGTTTLNADDIGIFITAIEGGGPLPAFFNLDATNDGDAVLSGPTDITQSFSGTFSITSALGGGGINYLSGSFTDGIFGSGTGLTLTASTVTPDEDVLFFVGAGSPITSLGLERAISLSFTNVLPFAAICNAADPTLCSFTSNVSGNMSANISIPEPGSLALLGLGLAGLGFVGRRKQY
jgi:hypothetical protein